MNIIWNKYTRRPLLKLLQFLPVKKNRVLCFSWGGQQYSDNPKAITNELLKSRDKYNWEIVYAFIDPDKFSHELPDGIEGVTLGSLRYFYLLATCRFIIANSRLNSDIWPFAKRKSQYYIQTMHGGLGLKRIELDVAEKLPKEYVDSLYFDASRVSLMISDSSFWTALARRVMAYPDGEILEAGFPANDVFFDSNALLKCREDIISFMGEEKTKSLDAKSVKILLYCPTFRNNHRTDVYGFDVDMIISSLEKRFGGIWYILISSHPNMVDYYQKIYDFSHERVVDVGKYDFQNALAASDVIITDYSSASFTFAITKKPVFLFARDMEEYDRGLYFPIESLPFDYAVSDSGLSSNIRDFDEAHYRSELNSFHESIGFKAVGKASMCVVEWMQSHLN